MNFDWKRPKVFRQSNHLISRKFSERFFFRKKSVDKIHIYQPWSKKLDAELLFKLKSLIQKKGETFIPFIDIKGEMYQLKADALVELQTQLLKEKSETQLVMFNGDVIHILRIKSICHQHEYSGKVVDCFTQKQALGMVVDDIYVYYANHLEDSSSAYHHLRDFIFSDKETPFFTTDCTSEGKHNIWNNEKRSFTYDYFVKTNELKDFTFQDNWENLSLLSRHHLIQLEICKSEYMNVKGFDQWRWHKRAMDLFSSAFLTELSTTFIFPLKQVALEFPFVKNVILDLIDNIQDKEFKVIMERVFKTQDEELKNLKDFFCFIRNIKFFIYGVSNQISKSFHNEEFLWVENFLNYYQGFSESLLTKKLIDKMQILVDCETWFKLQDNRVKLLSLKDLESLNLKSSQIIRLLTSHDPEDNLFFSLLEIKTEKALGKKPIEKSMDELISEDLNKLAS